MASRVHVREGRSREVVIGDDFCFSDVRRAWNEGKSVDFDRTFRNAHIYFALDASRGRLKVGVSNNVDRRISDLSKAAKTELRELGRIPGNRAAEMRIHRVLSMYRIEREWFLASAAVLGIVQKWIAGAAG